jgi:hypothetical protein
MRRIRQSSWGDYNRFFNVMEGGDRRFRLDFCSGKRILEDFNYFNWNQKRRMTLWQEN